MSTLTTIEELQKQLTLILGFSGKENLDVGEIIGVGKLTKEKTHELVLKVLEYLNAYNAMLRDYSGTEIYSIEFELKNFMPKRESLKLLPESMILIPREYKETNSIILALTYTTSLLDMDKSQNSIEKISKLFFEILEMVDRPELNHHEKIAVLTKFAKRFARKVQGELLESDWNKKLVGIRTASVDDEVNLEPFGEIQSKYKIKWNQLDREINTESPTYRSLQFTMHDGEKLNHLKWQISGPSGYYIAQKTIDLGAKLLTIANTGSINEVQVGIIKTIVEELDTRLSKITHLSSNEEILIEIKRHLREIKDIFIEFHQRMDKFLRSGYNNSLENITKKIKDLYGDVNPIKKKCVAEILKTQISLILECNFKNIDHVRLVEIAPCVNYFNQMMEASFTLLEPNIERFLSYTHLLRLFYRYIEHLYDEFNLEQTPAKSLGDRYIAKFAEHLIIRLHERIINSPFYIRYDRPLLNEEFKNLVQMAVENYIDEIPIHPEDLIRFTEVMLAKHQDKVNKHLTTLKKASSQLEFLLSYILRFNTLNRFVQEIDETKGSGSLDISNKFFHFLRKRIGGLDIEWKFYLLELIAQYQQDLHSMPSSGNWSKFTHLSNLIEYLRNSIQENIEPDRFMNVLDSYIAKIEDPVEKDIMLLVFEQYEYSLGIIEEFPAYVKQKLLKILTQLPYTMESLPTTEYLNPKFGETENLHLEKIHSKLDLFNFVYEYEMKYFSKLIARPVCVKLINRDQTEFEKPLIYSMDFKFWESFYKVSISNNWFQIRSKY
ncbi:MAG: hypothetical protein EU530_05670 [Promethearchaeota archaeon]|nr:MAG: hypothetical protein EU530_05670 [Candidatus Lokiarchaeota archaeon]